MTKKVCTKQYLFFNVIDEYGDTMDTHRKRKRRRKNGEEK